MPIPILLMGISAVAGLVGAGGHLSAKETNEKAQRISQDAQKMYNTKKESLIKAQNDTEKALLKLGQAKKKTLDYSMKQFLNSYEKIKHIAVNKSVGINKIEKFNIAPQDALQLREMTNIYSSAIKNSAKGAAAGTLVALAANGSLTIIAGELGTAGSILLSGGIGAAASVAGSAISLGAAMTPLAAIAAPVVLFTGISASMKAEENLEKAQVMYAEAEAACEKMKLSETLCGAIIEKSNMFNDVLVELDSMFSECASTLDDMVRKKEGWFFKKKLNSSDFSEEDLKLIAVTRALAGAIKAVIDTPILTKEGTLSEESEKVYEQTTNMLPCFEKDVEEVKRIDYNTKTVTKQYQDNQGQQERSKRIYRPNAIIKYVMWLLSIILFGNGLIYLLAGLPFLSVIMGIAGLIMCPKTDKTLRFSSRLIWIVILFTICSLFF